MGTEQLQVPKGKTGQSGKRTPEVAACRLTAVGVHRLRCGLLGVPAYQDHGYEGRTAVVTIYLRLM